MALAETYDVVINNGRVMDPETNFDGVRNLGVKDGRIVIITEDPISCEETIDATGLHNTTPEDFLRYAMLFTPSWHKVANEPIISEVMMEILHNTGRLEAFEGSEEQSMATDWFGYAPPTNGVQWDNVFDDGAMFKHGNNGQGIYVDPDRDFCAMDFGTAANTSGIDYAPGYMRAAAKRLAEE